MQETDMIINESLRNQFTPFLPSSFGHFSCGSPHLFSKKINDQKRSL